MQQLQLFNQTYLETSKGNEYKCSKKKTFDSFTRDLLTQTSLMTKVFSVFLRKYDSETMKLISQ